MLYEVIVLRRARKSASRIPVEDRELIFATIRALAEDPRPRGARKMRGTGSEEEWRVQVGRNYRVVYRVDDESREVIVLAIGHRGSVYN